MGSEPLTLGFDTSAAHCAAALLSGDKTIAVCSEEMSRGQAERLMPLLEEVLASASVNWADLSRIGVGVGPGNFTGIRISVSAARGLSLALGIPAIGVSSFDAIEHLADGSAVAVVPAPRDQLYIRKPDASPQLLSLSEVEALGQSIARLPDADRLVAAIAQCAAVSEAISVPPAPLYMRPADAAPSRDTPPVILDDHR